MTFSLALLALLCAALAPASAHVFMFYPPQRGALWGNLIIPGSPVCDIDAPRDFAMHFPAGDKNQIPGSGLASQRRAAGPRGWTEFKPEQPGFRWRAGVCGDKLFGNEHLKGGKFYYGGKICATYRKNGIISIDMGVVANHNGYFEFRLCDMRRCGGRMSPQCFRNGGCRLLKRVWDRSCESRFDRRCGPIDPDPRYSARWHLTCPRFPRETMGKGKIRYWLPKGWAGPHFVLHMYHVAANSCMPPGVTAYFEGPRGPRWGNCPGQGGARGGYRPFPRLCGGRNFAEEYFQCADIAILGKHTGGGPLPQPPSQPRQPQRRPQRRPQPPNRRFSRPGFGGSGPLKRLVLFADGRRRASFTNNAIQHFNVRFFRRLTFQADVYGQIWAVHFTINGGNYWKETSAPYFYQGNYPWGYRYWSNPIIGRSFVLKAVAFSKKGRHELKARITLYK